jgi:hypothetical protein
MCCIRKNYFSFSIASGTIALHQNKHVRFENNEKGKGARVLFDTINKQTNLTAGIASKQPAAIIHNTR